MGGKKVLKGMAVICLIIGVLCFFVEYGMFVMDSLGEAWNLLFVFGIGFLVLAGMLAVLSEHDVEWAIGLAIIAIILFSYAVGFTIMVLRNEEQNKIRADYFLHGYDSTLDWEIKAYNDAISIYKNYTNDTAMIDAYRNIITIHPFLKEQTVHLRGYMDVLIDNVTEENYNTALNQYVLCHALDTDYGENYTFYFGRLDAVYDSDHALSWLASGDFSYVSTEDEPYLVVLKEDVGYYTDELGDISRKLSYVNNVLAELEMT